MPIRVRQHQRREPGPTFRVRPTSKKGQRLQRKVQRLEDRLEGAREDLAEHVVLNEESEPVKRRREEPAEEPADE